MNHRYLPVLLLSIWLNCVPSKENRPELSHDYMSGLDKWKADRMEEVIGNWVSLAGLHWLEEGITSFGSDSSNQIIFPPGSPSRIGYIYFSGDSIKMTLNGDIPYRLNDLQSNQREHTVNESKRFKIGDLEWTVIERVGKYAVRVWDHSITRETKDNFKLQYFKPDPEWIIEARYESYPEGKSYPIANIIGYTTETPIPGKLVFEFNNTQYSLDVMKGNDESWFVIFADETNGETTYGAGRYIYVNKVPDGSVTKIDFNKSYNPPCAFTEYATCPLPPPQNRLPVAINAGEKAPDTDH